ncbi:MAG: T9SS type A sorting domain-containing protein [Bacteroidetes bacterium]|nr:T9SS type A sorting domain-containing protein [Bacteroidota bacterium]
MIAPNHTTSIIISMAILLTASFSGKAQSVFWSEDFETDGTGTRYAADNQFIDADGSSEDYFGRVENQGATLMYTGCVNDPIDVTNPYSGQNGNFFFAGEDLDDTGGCGAPLDDDSKSLSFLSANGHSININGATGITFKLLVANGANNTCGSSIWDIGDGLKVFYAIDGAPEILGLCFSPNIFCNDPMDDTNEPLNYDANCDGDGEDGIINNIFSEYSFSIPSGGSSLELRIEATAGGGDEEIAFDYLRLEAITPPFPIELLSFTAFENGSGATLEWATATETNNDYFEIERSRNGQQFEKIGEVEGAGNSIQRLDYFFSDNKPHEGINYYRIRQVDFDGTFSFSHLASVRFDQSSNQISISPNPTSGDLYISGLPSDEITEISIFNINGQRLKRLATTDAIVDLADLPQGIYLLTIKTATEVITHKVIRE